MTSEGVNTLNRAVSSRRERGEPVAIELGCGSRKRNASAIGIDLLDGPDVDVVGDAMTLLAGIPSSSVDSIESYHFLEHVEDLPGLLKHCQRVLKMGGEMIHRVPHFACPYTYSDPTHKTFFGLYTFSYLFENERLRRKVPSYQRVQGLRVESIKLAFRSARMFLVFAAIRKWVVEPLVNASAFTQEFHEFYLCWLIPCYDIEVRVRKAN